MEDSAAPKQSIRRILLGGVGVMVLVATMLAAWVGYEIYRDLDESRWIELTTRSANAVLRASAAYARERGYTATLLADPQPATAQSRAELKRLREAADAQYRQMLGLGESMAAHAPSHPAVRALETAAAWHDELKAARAQAERAFAGERAAISVAAWIETVNRFIDMLAHARRDAMVPRSGARLGQYYTFLLENIYQVIEYAGRERALVSGAIAAARPLDEPEQVMLRNYRMHVEENLGMLEDAIADLGDAELGSAYGGLRQEFLERYERLREAVYSASRARQPYPVTATRWYAEATSAINAALDVADAISKRASAADQAAQAAAMGSMYGLLLAALAAAALIAFVARMTHRHIFRPLKALAAGANNIANGDLATPISPARDDEIGHLALALDKMRCSLSGHIERLRAVEAALREREARLRYLMDESPAIIYAAVPSGDFSFTFVSHNVSALLGYTPEEVLQDPNFWAEHIHPDDARALFSRLVYLFREGQQTHKYRFRRQDGVYRWMHDQLRVIYDENGNPTEVIGSMSDFTELQQLQEQLLQSHRDLEEAHGQLLQSEKMASIGQLAAGVAHEINNPIGYVYSNVGSLEKYLKDLFEVINAYEQAEAGLHDAGMLEAIRAVKVKADLEFLREDMQALLAESKEGITRVKKIVQDLKDFSHVDAADEWHWADLRTGLDTTLNIVWNEIKYKAEVKKEYGAIPEIECLPSQLNQVFMNLLVNAAHAIEERGVITIRSGAEGEGVWVEIADSGKGIPPEHLNRIFDPFFTTKPIGKGTGLGLSLAYGIVQKHHGRIEVQSEVGRGTTFRVWLPLRRAETEEAA